MKYLKKFNTHSEYEAYMEGEPILPNVSICSDEPNVVHYNPASSLPLFLTSDRKRFELADGKVLAVNLN